jgi:hypothetical protein
LATNALYFIYEKFRLSWGRYGFNQAQSALAPTRFKETVVGRPDRRLPPVQSSAKKFFGLEVPDGYRGTLLPVRKSLTKKSGIMGLSTRASRDSLVFGGESDGLDCVGKNLSSQENVLSLKRW